MHVLEAWGVWFVLLDNHLKNHNKRRRPAPLFFIN